jgi:DNA repair protein RecO (recombination protein O)
MRLSTEAIILSARPHGEHDSIVRALTPDDGVQPGYVRGGRSRRLRPILQPGNVIAAEYRARTEDQLAHLTPELVRSRAPLLAEPLTATAIEWATVLTATALPEAQPYPALYAGLSGLLDALEAAPSARGWGVALVRYELLLLGELGFGLDLTECAVTGDTAGLAFVSPRSGRAVSRAGAGDYRERLLALPAFLAAGGPARDWDDIVAGLRITGHFLARDVLIERQADVLASRGRLLDRLNRLTSPPPGPNEGA